MKSLSRAVLLVYLFVLLWLILFKFSSDIASVLHNYQSRSLNLIPFAHSSRSSIREAVENVLVFIPLGILLGINFKRVAFRKMLVLIILLSIGAEILQGILAIGATDITDVLTNSLGGFVGLILYDTTANHSNTEEIDRIIVITSAMLLIAFVVLRIFVFRVSYHPPR